MSKTLSRRKKSITRRDAERIAEIAEFRHILAETTYLRFYPGESLEAARSWLRGMTDVRVLQSDTFWSNEKYWWPTDKGVSWLKERHGISIPRRSSSPLPVTRKAELHAFLLFCSRPGQPLLRRARPCLMRDAFPEIYQKYMQSKKRDDPLRMHIFYHDEQRDTFGLFRFDNGNQNYLKDVVQPKFNQLVSTYPSIQARVNSDRFELAVVTTTPQREAALHEQFEAAPPFFPWKIHLFSEVEAIQRTANRRSKQSPTKKGNRSG